MYCSFVVVGVGSCCKEAAAAASFRYWEEACTAVVDSEDMVLVHYYLEDSKVVAVEGMVGRILVVVADACTCVAVDASGMERAAHNYSQNALHALVAVSEEPCSAEVVDLDEGSNLDFVEVEHNFDPLVVVVAHWTEEPKELHHPQQLHSQSECLLHCCCCCCWCCRCRSSLSSFCVMLNAE